MAEKGSWGLSSACAGGVGLDGYLYAVLQFLETFGGDGFPGLQALDRRIVPICRADSNGADRSALVGLDDIDKRSLRVALDCGGGDENCVVRGVHQQPGIDELIGKQRTIFIWKNGLEFESSRGCIDLVVQRQKGSGGELFLLPAIECVHDHALSLAQLRLDLRQVVLSHGKDHGDRLELSDDDQGGG